MPRSFSPGTPYLMCLQCRTLVCGHQEAPRHKPFLHSCTDGKGLEVQAGSRRSLPCHPSVQHQNLPLGENLITLSRLTDIRFRVLCNYQVIMITTTCQQTALPWGVGKEQFPGKGGRWEKYLSSWTLPLWLIWEEVRWGGGEWRKCWSLVPSPVPLPLN